MNKFFKTVLLTGLFVGTTDIVSAFISVYIQSGKFPEKMFNYIAGGALGLPAAINGGTAAGFFGFVFPLFYRLFFHAVFLYHFPQAEIFSF